MRATLVFLAFALSPAPAAAQQINPAKVDATVKAAFPTAAADWAARLTGDETMRQCSAARNNPSREIAAEIQKRELATIVYPPDNNFLGDWRKGEALAQ